MHYDDLRQHLVSLADEKYRQFSGKLIPESGPILGVRLPELKKIAKELAEDDWEKYLAAAKDDSFEEVMLQGLVIGCIKADLAVVWPRVKIFVPKINNWSLCDSFCANLKIVRKNREKVWELLQEYLSGSQPFAVRFGVVLLLDHYLTEEYIGRVLNCLDKVKKEDYYVQMAVAWALSIAYIKFPELTLAYLKENSLDDFTYNKALQKIIESRRVSPDDKVKIRKMKRK